jgi:hypothetical protein
VYLEKCEDMLEKLVGESLQADWAIHLSIRFVRLKEETMRNSGMYNGLGCDEQAIIQYHNVRGIASRRKHLALG